MEMITRTKSARHWRGRRTYRLQMAGLSEELLYSVQLEAEPIVIRWRTVSYISTLFAIIAPTFDVTDALKKLVVGNGESRVRVTVKGSPDYAISQREGIFVIAAQKAGSQHLRFILRLGLWKWHSVQRNID